MNVACAAAKLGHSSSERARSCLRISRLMRAASCEDVSINCTQRRASPSIFDWFRRYEACRIPSSALLRSWARVRRRMTFSCSCGTFACSAGFLGTITFVICELQGGDTYTDTTSGRVTMANREVNLTKRINTSTGLRYCPVALSPNGRVKPDLVMVNNKPEHHPEGCYYIEWRENGKRKRLSVGKDAADANARRLRKEAELNAINNG